MTKPKDWASDEGLEELKKCYAAYVESKDTLAPPLPNLEVMFECVPQLIEALEEARAFANGTNGELIGIIRSITDRAGANGVPFLDDAVRRIAFERDDAIKRIRTLVTLAQYAEHKSDCSPTASDCSCGLDRARREAQV